MVGTILVGADGSRPSKAALQWSIERAKTTGMKVLITHVVELGGDLDGIASDAREAALARVHADAALATLAAPSLSVAVQVLRGDPLTELAKATEVAELLVLGTHKTGFIHGKLFGSRFLGLAAVAHCAVAFIPDMVGNRRRGIVAALDDSPGGETVIRFAAAEAQRNSEELTLVSSRGAKQFNSDKTLADNTALARAGNHGIIVRARYSSKSTAEGLIDAASSASLLVVDHTRHANDDIAVLGAVAHDVLLNINSPTVVLVGGPA